MNHRLCRRFAPALIVLALFGGCSGPPSAHRAEETITDALGLSEALVFRTQAGPLDEPDAPTGTLTSTEAVRRAALTDSALQAALARVRIALADADQVRLLPNPVLNFILTFPEHGGRPGIEAELTGDLLSVVQIPRRTSAADHRLRAAAADAVTVALDAVAEAQERYAAVQALDELMPVLDERQRLLEKLIQLARDRLEAGEGTGGDVTTLESRRVELDVERAQKQLELGDERLHLARLIGVPSSEALWKVEPWRAPTEIASSESAWVEAGLANRPEIRAVTWELSALGDDEALTRFAPFESAGAGVKAERGDAWSVGPSVTTPIPIFDTGQARQAKATARQIEVRHQLTLAQRRAVEDVRRAYRSFFAARANLERVRTELIPLQRRRREQAEDAYRAGHADVTALLLAEQDLLASMAKQIELEQAVAVSLLRLERAVGGSGVGARIDRPVDPAPKSAGLTDANGAEQSIPSTASRRSTETDP